MVYILRTRNHDTIDSIHVFLPASKGLRHHDLRLLILIPQPLKCWDYKNMIQHPAPFSILMCQSQQSHNISYQKIKLGKLFSQQSTCHKIMTS